MASVTEDYSTLPRFPDGRIDYTNSNSAPIVSCVVEHGGKVLIVRRSDKVAHDKSKWDVITGYIDNPGISAEEHASLELEEEIGVTRDDVSEIIVGEPKRYNGIMHGKIWTVFPVLVRLNCDPRIRLNDENTDFRWINPSESSSYDAVRHLERAISNAFALSRE